MESPLRIHRALGVRKRRRVHAPSPESRAQIADLGFKIGGEGSESKSMRLLLRKTQEYAQEKQARLSCAQLLRHCCGTMEKRWYECSTARASDSRKRVPDVSRLTLQTAVLNNVSMDQRLYHQAPAYPRLK